MRGFVTYVPWPGDVNNVRLNFESIAVLAHLLDRHIAIPDQSVRNDDEPEHLSDGTYRPLNPNQFFDLSSLPVMRLSDLSRDSTMFEVPPFEPDTKILSLESSGSDDAFASGRGKYSLPQIALSADIIRFPRLLTPFYAMISGGIEMRRRATSFVRDHVRHPVEIERIAKQIASALGEFHAVMVRRNEFIRYYPQTDINIETIHKHIAEAVPSGSQLLISTDESDRSFFDLLTRRYRVLYARDVVYQVAPSLDWSQRRIGCIEQNLCALADSFVGTRLSTFSAYINRLRGYHGCDDTRVRFTDGTHLRVRDNEGWPQFSWEPARRLGEPLWSREFREGWTL